MLYRVYLIRIFILSLYSYFRAALSIQILIIPFITIAGDSQYHLCKKYGNSSIKVSFIVTFKIPLRSNSNQNFLN